MRVLFYTVLGLLLALSHTAQADRFANVQVEATELAPNLYMLTGAGGNMAALVGNDGILLIDAQFAGMADKIQAKLHQLGEGQSLKLLINTHFHGDHVGANAAFAEQARIVAHDNVRVRLAADSNFPVSGLPDTTFNDRLVLHKNGQTIHVQAMQASHTDGDVIIWFEQANVLHTGDLMFEGRFPFIDTNAGGNLHAYIENTQLMIEKINEQTQVIPGHGQLTNQAGLKRELAMMKATLALVQQHKDNGLSEQAIIEQGLGDEWLDWHWNFITEERWIRTLYQALAK